MKYREAEALFKRCRNPMRGYRLPGRQGSTRLVRRGDDYAIRLYQTDVVTIHKRGGYTVATGGWYTVTTKDRIRTYSNAYFYKFGDVFLLSTKHVSGWYEFNGPVKISANGRPNAKKVDERECVRARARRLRAEKKAAALRERPQDFTSLVKTMFPEAARV